MNPAIPSLLQVEGHRRGVGEPEGWRMSFFDPTKAIAELKCRLALGEMLGDSLRTMFHEDGYGLMELYHAVARVHEISAKEAMRIVVHETESWGGRRGAAARTTINPRIK